MINDLLQVSLRQSAIYIDNIVECKENQILSVRTANFMRNIRKLGFTVSQPLLHQLNHLRNGELNQIFDFLINITGMDANWAPLVKDFEIPTNETELDHFITYLYNILECGNPDEGIVNPCGHFIPFDTFPIQRYNGCPFCGTPFQFGEVENLGQGSKLKVLNLWTDKDLNDFFKNLLESKTALDATQTDSLSILMKELPLPKATITIKETLMLVIDSLIEYGDGELAGDYFTSPTDILRYLWYKKTGFLQIIEPKTICKRSAKNDQYMAVKAKGGGFKRKNTKEELNLKYDRTYCRMVATWLNKLPMDTEKMCESMHSKRGMWVRFIRALRLAEYAKKEGFDKLKDLLDIFYNQVYEVWQGEVNKNRLKMNQEATFNLLKQRPGLFARSLFANMLWFGSDATLQAFGEVVSKIPARLLITLSMYANNYFDSSQKRIVKPLGDINKVINANQLLNLCTEEECETMVQKVKDLVKTEMFIRFSSQENTNKAIYIDPQLFNIPLAIGDRSDSVQDFSGALQGTRFPIEGDKVRVFMQWGVGLPAQHLDLDLSVHIAFKGKIEVCSYYNLTTKGAKHSGDIQQIPDKVGAAEYVELDIEVLRQIKAKYVAFTCNAYTSGAISPTVVLGWMNSKHQMKISNKTGVAYDPSCVQHQVRVNNPLTKGLVFGVIDVDKNEIVWLEIPFDGQIVANLNADSIEVFLKKLAAKLSIGELLTLKAEAQNLELVRLEKADEIYDLSWAINTAAVTQLLIDQFYTSKYKVG